MPEQKYKPVLLFSHPEFEYRPEPPEPPEQPERVAQVLPLSSRVQMPKGKSKLVMLRDAKKRASDRTAKARAAAAEKRATRLERGEYFARDVRVWFEEATRLHTSLSRLPSWRPQDHSNAKRLLTEFGGEQLRDTVFWFFENWEGYVAASRGKLSGIPTPSLLIAMKSQVFVDCEMGRVPNTDSSKRERVRGSEWDADSKPSLDPDDWGLD